MFWKYLRISALVYLSFYFFFSMCILLVCVYVSVCVFVVVIYLGLFVQVSPSGNMNKSDEFADIFRHFCRLDLRVCFLRLKNIDSLKVLRTFFGYWYLAKSIPVDTRGCSRRLFCLLTRLRNISSSSGRLLFVQFVLIIYVLTHTLSNPLSISPVFYRSMQYSGSVLTEDR